MHPFIIYIIKSVAISGSFYAYYHVLLRNRQLHGYNRFFVLSAMVLSMVLPLLHIQWTNASAGSTPAAIKLLQVITVGGLDETPDYGDGDMLPIAAISAIAYFAIVAGMLLAVALKVLSLYTIKRKLPKKKEGDTYIIYTQLDAAPFSFLNNLYWKESIDRDSVAGSRIMRHELVHIRQYHTVDKLFTKVVLAFFWMNPFFWLFQKELSLVHEFLADEGSIDNNDTTALAEMLLHAQFGSRYPGIIQPFFYSPIKRRLTMLRQNKTKYANLRKLLVLPVLAGTVLLFSFSVKEKKVYTTTNNMVLLIDAGHGGRDAGATSVSGLQEKDLTLKIAQELARVAPEYNITTVQTREGDKYPTLDERVATAKDAGADVLISIHINKNVADEPHHKGYEVYVSHKNPKYPQSQLLASSIMNNLGSSHPTLKEKGLIVLKGVTIPAVLIECGNIDNVEDVAVLQDNAKLEQMCRNVLAGVVAYKSAK